MNMEKTLSNLCAQMQKRGLIATIYKDSFVECKYKKDALRPKLKMMQVGLQMWFECTLVITNQTERGFYIAFGA